MRRCAVFAVGLALLATAALAGEAFKDTEYISGHTGFAKKLKGTLVIEESAVQLVGNDGRLLLEIPITQIVKATDSHEQNSGSFGRKMALGLVASKNEEFLTVETRSAENAEEVVFKTTQKTAAGIAAKINFHVSRLQQESKPLESKPQ